MDALRLLLNLVWLVLAGVWMAIGYAIAGVIMCVLVVTIPWGIAAFRIALFTLWPFGRAIERRGSAGVGSTLGNVVWFVLAGWWLALGHVVTAIPLAVSIVGLPFAWANLKLIPVSLTPLGRRVVGVDDVRFFDVGRPVPVGAPVGGPVGAPSGPRTTEVPWYQR